MEKDRIKATTAAIGSHEGAQREKKALDNEKALP